MDNKQDFPEIELLNLRKKVRELETKLGQYEQTLKENGLLESLSSKSDLLVICEQQLAKFRELSEKGVPFLMEDSKNFEVIAKVYLAATGKAPEEKKTPKAKKQEEHDVANLLKLASKK